MEICKTCDGCTEQDCSFARGYHRAKEETSLDIKMICAKTPDEFFKNAILDYLNAGKPKKPTRIFPKFN